jgi:hypothetical protein
MNRAALAQYGQLEFGPLLQQAYAPQTPPGEAGPVWSPRMQVQLELCLDQSYLLLGADETALPDPPLSSTQAAAATAALDYFLLRSVSRTLALGVDWRTADQAEQASQRAKALDIQLTQAAAYLASLGFPVDGKRYEQGSLILDFLEPAYPWSYPLPAVPY